MDIVHYCRAIYSSKCSLIFLISSPSMMHFITEIHSYCTENVLNIICSVGVESRCADSGNVHNLSFCAEDLYKQLMIGAVFVVTSDTIPENQTEMAVKILVVCVKQKIRILLHIPISQVYCLKCHLTQIPLQPSLFFIPPNCNDVLSGAEIDGKTLRVREYVRDSLIFYQNISLTVEKNKVNKLRQIRDNNDGISNNNDSNDC